MKTLVKCLIIITFFSCKNESSTQTTITKNEKNLEKPIVLDSIMSFSETNNELEQEKTKALKLELLNKIEDDKIQLQKLVITKELHKEKSNYILNYRYPFLNEKLDSSYTTFNNYIRENYLNIEKTETEILENIKLPCDTIKTTRLKDKRIIDFKIYTVKNDFISLFLYKENYYSGMLRSTYLFDCLNFDLKNHEFLYFNDFFETNTENEVLTIINTIITNGINTGELYYDCWELSEGDFKAYKNNFIFNDNMVEYYFDDCIICPSYTGSYSIEIPINNIKHLLKKELNAPLIE